MGNLYKTILKESVAEIIEKKSRFIATVRPVSSEEEAKAFIEEMRKKYWDAAHNVFAYQIGLNNELQRSSDDGEPQGTAGKPVLGVLCGEDVKNCCIVVTRYFGGTLLGTGGLVRAYGKAAKEGLLAAGIAEVYTFYPVSVTVEYTLQGKVQYALMQAQHIIKDTIYTDKVTFQLLIAEDKLSAFQKEMINVTSAAAIVAVMDPIRGAWADGVLTEVSR